MKNTKWYFLSKLLSTLTAENQAYEVPFDLGMDQLGLGEFEVAGKEGVGKVIRVISQREIWQEVRNGLLKGKVSFMFSINVAFQPPMLCPMTCNQASRDPGFWLLLLT